MPKNCTQCLDNWASVKCARCSSSLCKKCFCVQCQPTEKNIENQDIPIVEDIEEANSDIQTEEVSETQEYE